MRIPQPKVSKRELRAIADDVAEHIYGGGSRESAFTSFVIAAWFDGKTPEGYWDWARLNRIEGSYHDVIALEVSQALVRIATKKVTARAARLAAKREANRRYRIKRGLPVTEVAA